MDSSLAILQQQLLQLNEDERFYKACHEARQKGTLHDFLSQQDMSALKKRKLIIEEQLPDCNKAELVDEEYFAAASRSAVYLSKHNRYTPAFWHTHVFFEIICVLTGEARHQINGESMTLRAGDFCLVSPAVPHSLYVCDDNSLVINLLLRRKTLTDVFFSIMQDDSLIAAFLRNSLYQREHSNYLLFQTSENSPFLQMILEMFQEQIRADRYSDRIISGMATVFLTKLVRDFGNSVQGKSIKGTKEAAQLLLYILNHLQNATLKDAAQQLGYSVPYCSRMVKVWTGSTFKELVLDIRFERAVRLLEETVLTIGEISTATGYENPENFMRMFKKRFGLTPTAYRCHYSTRYNRG